MRHFIRLLLLLFLGGFVILLSACAVARYPQYNGGYYPDPYGANYGGGYYYYSGYYDRDYRHYRHYHHRHYHGRYDDRRGHHDHDGDHDHYHYHHHHHHRPPAEN